MTFVAIASRNKIKVEAVKHAFINFLGDKPLNMIDVDAESEVPNQPFDEEVHDGASNRLRNLRKLSKDSDFYVACEGGLVKLFGTYYNVHIVIIEDRCGHKSEGISQGYPIPDEYVKEIRNTSLADVLDRIFEGEGGIRKLTNNAYTREDLVYQATVMALTGLMNGEKWKVTSK